MLRVVMNKQYELLYTVFDTYAEYLPKYLMPA